MTEQRYKDRHHESAFELATLLQSRARRASNSEGWLGKDPHEEPDQSFGALDSVLYDRVHVANPTDLDSDDWRVIDWHSQPSPKTFIVDTNVALSGTYKATIQHLSAVIRDRMTFEFPMLYWGEARTAVATPTVDEDLVREFATLSKAWADETVLSSSIEQTVLHPAYQQIIGLGADALPLILRELENSPGYWYWALASIAREDPAADASDFEEARSSWLAWGREKGYLPDEA